ncbi:MAG: inosine/xanthosine triphosphatase [Candidatus Micrarchaeota archaeon]|nr:inosine/xanthosine triphosphatase [Candidatus Micrarchaeota archaeon]
MRHCILGGTFTYVHEGHRRLLAECAKCQKITIGLTSDSYVRRRKLYPSLPYHKRLAGLKKELGLMGMAGRAEIVKIDDEIGGADSIAEADCIIVSQETEAAAKKINRMRRQKGLPLLKIISVPLAYGEDLRKISCAAIYEGKTDLSGRLAKPLEIQLATENPTKVQGAALALRKIFGEKFRLQYHAENSGVPAHPFNQETAEGAANRAHAAWKRARGKCDYSIGMESGLFSSLVKGKHVDVTVACVYDGEEETYGTGMGFVVPEKIVRMIKAEGSDLSEALRKATGVEKIGWKQGALGWFSDGAMHRREQIEAAVACAFVPRIARAKNKLG